MFYKITKFGDAPDSLGFKYSSIGMVEVLAAFYLEEGDEGWDKYNQCPFRDIRGHLVPANPQKDIYSGQRDEKGYPIDLEDYEKWLSTVSTALNQFCNHSIQFEPEMLPHDENGLTKEATDNVDYCFQWALGITAKNYLLDDLACKVGGQKVNQDIGYLSRCAYYMGISVIAKQTPDNLTSHMQADIAKISNAEAKATAAKSTDLTAIPMSLVKK